jgi:hypothetical protein
LEKRLSGVAELRDIMVYGKSQLEKKSLIAQNDLGKTIDVVRRKFYYLSLYLGNIS